MVLIDCRGVVRSFAKGTEVITPLAGVDLQCDAGAFLALMGPSGSGKTTLLNILAGIDRPTAGEVIIEGQDIAGLSRSALADWRANNIGYVFQLYNLVPILTAYENVELPLLLHNMTRKERHAKVALALDLVDLADRHDHFPRQLSGGQEQRVSIARAIVTDPHLILADEPTGDLDRRSGEAILELMRRLNQELGKTFIMVTHDADATCVATRTVHLEDGRLVADVSTQHAGEEGR